MKLMILKVVAWSTVTTAVGSSLVLASVGPTWRSDTACTAPPARSNAVDVRDAPDDRAAALLTSTRGAPAARP